MKKLVIYICLLVASIVLSTMSFQVGYLKGKATEHADPFRWIKDQSHSPYPSIDGLLKK